MNNRDLLEIVPDGAVIHYVNEWLFVTNDADSVDDLVALELVLDIADVFVDCSSAGFLRFSKSSELPDSLNMEGGTLIKRKSSYLTDFRITEIYLISLSDENIGVLFQSRNEGLAIINVGDQLTVRLGRPDLLAGEKLIYTRLR